ncbi:glycoside hydrolase family 108 protein [Acidimangrovimonas sediminis]|uniref:glycoside hydrolase family 108 protein n=1 Tax=Acidimangrovimonas sediminis TaxID=2056283 RepID=UPI000C7F9D73|nr:glycosyl hydrolase 108 family protein [Acidimangrovimonas sediminis]
MPDQDKFVTCFKEVIGEEGDYVNDPRDPGGETKFGIAKRYNPNVDIKALTLEQAREIYRTKYWDPAQCDLLPLAAASVYFDAVVNMGQDTAVRLMQTALGETSDGVIGPRTRGAMRRRGKDPELIVNFQAERGIYYAGRGHFEIYGRGWLRRVIRGAMEAARIEADGEVAA